MKIYFDNTEIDLPVNDNSYRYRAIKGEHSLTLYYSLPQHVEIPIGAYCIFEGEEYTLEKPENFKMHNTRNFEYTLIMDSAQEKLSKYKFRDISSRRLKFPLTAQPQEHLKMLIDNLNQRESGWTAGDCIAASEKVISYNHAYCIDALTQMADEFETEWEIVGKKISLRKVEYNKDNPLPLSYGRGNGFKSGVGRANESNSKPIEILFVQGGERNINASTYGSSELLLPKNQTLEYEGRTYVSDSDGFSIRRADKALTTGVEDSLDLSNIYPSRVGDVTSVVVVDAENHFYDFVDNTIPADLDFTKYIIEGETLTVIFQSGMLAGKEFEVKYIHADRRFEIVPQEIDGRTMPDSVFKPVAKDTYAVFGMMMPDAYICNNAAKTGASWDMFREAAKYLYENEGQKFTFTGELDGIWAKKDWLNIGGRIKLGGYILFSDNQFQPDGVSIRIIGIKDFINNPHSPVIELSNSVVGSSITSDLNKIASNEVFVDSLHKDAIQFTKRRYRDSIETMTMLENALLENFTGSITPITVQTMSLLVGDESLQFRFVNNTTTPTEIAHNVAYNKETKILTSPAGIIQHMTLGIDTISSSHTVGEYKFWTLPEFNTPVLTDGSKKYYLYAKVSKTATTGTFYISERAIGMEEVSGYYHLLVGILNSEYEGERSYVSLYGFTEILPGRMTTNKVVSSDGLNFIDFLNNAARIGDANAYIDFNTKKDGKLKIKGTIVQSESGDENFIGVFRGVYNSSYTYYQGDEVTYTANGGTSTYRYIHATPTRGALPTNATYWQVIASKGGNGDWVSYAFKQSTAQPATPTGTSVVPSGWSDAPTSTGRWWLSKATINGDTGLAGTWSAPIQVTAEDGIDGAYTDFKYRVNTSATSVPTLSTSSRNPSGWSDAPPALSTGQYLWMTQAKIKADDTLDGTWSTPVRISGEKGDMGNTGDTGATGDFYEYRYAVNGSRTAYPTLSVTSAAPSGWSTTMPTVGSLQYLWCTIAKKSASGTLLQNWSTPTRVTGYDGKDGADGAKGDTGPTMVFRGIYSSSATYYGTSKRVDCVKYNNTYYIARVDAGDGFTNKVPTNTDYWNDFGAQFESVATNLLLAENANIADWIIKSGKITSQNTTSDGTARAQMDGAKGGISFASDISKYTASGGTKTIKQIINLDSQTGDIESRTTDYDTAYMNSQGIFANRAGIQALPASAGIELKAAIVALGYGDLQKSAYGGAGALCGVYGIASNSNSDPAPTYGGYFKDLFAAGLVLNKQYITGSSNSTTYLSKAVSFVLSFATGGIQTVYLPSNPMEGHIIYLKQLNSSTMRVYPYPGQKLLDDSSENTYYDVGEGQALIAVCIKGSVSSVSYTIWVVNRIKY